LNEIENSDGAILGTRPPAGQAETPFARRRIRIFSSPTGEPRFRRATDVVLLVPSLVALAILIAIFPPGSFERLLARLLDTVPGFTNPVWGFLYDLLAAWTIALLVAAALSRRGFVLAQAAAAFALAAAVAFVCARLATGDWPELDDLVRRGATAPPFPDVRIAETVAVLLTISPRLVQPLQRASRWLLLLGFVCALFVDSAVPSGVAAAFLIGVVTAAVVRLSFGTSVGRAGLDAVAESLAEVGIEAGGLEFDPRQVAGVVSVRARDPVGRRLLVEVFGRDAYDNQLLEKLWRTLWYQDGGPGLRLGPAQVAEHEAFVTLLARNAGVPTHEVLRAADTTGGNALLVLRGDDRPLEALAAEEVDEAVLAGGWRTLAHLHGARIAHRRIDIHTVALVDGEVGLVDFAGATAAPTADQLLTDRAQLLVTTSTVAGTERALAAAVAEVGKDGVAELLPYLQPAALRASLRQATKAAGIDLDELRSKTASLVGTEPPELVRLRRVTVGTLVQAALLLFAGLAVLSFAIEIDYGQLWTGLQSATWGWVLLGFLVAQLPRLSQATATLGSVPADVRFGPLYGLQLATNYMNLALPGSAARLAVNIRFFQRHGITPTAAVTAGAIDSFASTFVQGVLLALMLLFTEADLNLKFSAPTGGSLVVVALIAGLVLVGLVAVAVVGRLRRVIVDRVRRFWPEVRAALSTLRSSDKLALLLGGSLATEILFALALGLFALGLGTRISLADLLVLNIGVSLINTIIPIPGGIGISELGLTVGLAAAGMSDEAALTAVLLYRISTFYLPPAWGFFAMRYLQRNRYL
jgi:glycosyltransferase 2 family protein